MASSRQPTNLFLVGASGYIGGSVLAGFLRNYPHFVYTTLVRNPDNIPAIEALGVKAIKGSHDDAELIEKIAAGNDIVVNCADADDIGLTRAILKGLSQQASMVPGGRPPILIHTSGTAVVCDKPDGAFHTETAERIYDDANLEDIKGIPENAPHRAIDLLIFEAAENGLVDAYIVAPSTIYGKGRGPCKTLSIQVNEMIRTAVKRKEVVIIGPGTNIWNNVHIDDLVQLYLLVFAFAITGVNKSVAYGNFFFGSAGQHIWGNVAKELARLLHQKGLVKDDTVRSVSAEEAPGLVGTAANSRTVANHGFALGWKPEARSLMEYLPDEVERTVATMYHSPLKRRLSKQSL
ncbi:hypothetical protein FRB99_000106 [Tulasnella sp. 403]|nr:hypothetical protein FRB99_000106 [Tulasnella sp. 403]